jgi:uncharacterized protein
MHVDGILFFGIWRIGGLMLLGMAAFRLGVFSGNRDGRFYARLMAAGYGIGLPLTLFSAFNLTAHNFDPLYAVGLGGLPNYLGSILVALGHVGLVMLALKRGWLAGLARRLAAVGRMALSNYLMHSVVLTTVFYGYGLALYGAVDRSAQMGFVAALLGVQVWLSSWWLARFRFGPAEWLWRSVTYGSAQPFRR